MKKNKLWIILVLIIILLMLVTRFAYVGFNQQVHGRISVLTNAIDFFRIIILVLSTGYLMISYKIWKLLFQNYSPMKKYISLVLFWILNVISLIIVLILGALCPIPLL